MIIAKELRKQKKRRDTPSKSILFLLSTSNYMILDYDINFNTFLSDSFQSVYDSAVRSHLSAYTCPHSCHDGEHSGLVISNTYMRYIYLNSDQHILIRIIVLRCPVCGTYHAVLPSFLLPFYSYSYPFIMETLFQFYFGKLKQNKSQICRLLHISRKTLEHFLSVFSFEVVRSAHLLRSIRLFKMVIRMHHDKDILFPFLFRYHCIDLAFLTVHIQRHFVFIPFHPPNKKEK